MTPPTPRQSSRKMAPTTAAPSEAAAEEPFTPVPSTSRAKPLSRIVKTLSKCRVEFHLAIPARDKITDAAAKLITTKKLTPIAAYVRHLMQTIIRLYQSEDSQVFILPWSSTSPIKPLDDPANLPLKPEDLRVFANGLKNNISWNSVAWFSLHFPYGEDGPCLDNFPSFGTHTTWFSENKQNAYNHTLHDSEREC
jgi:hypothetical protein